MTPAPSGHSRRWLFGDQLGPHFLEDDDQQVVLVESTRVLSRNAVHRQKAHLVLSAMRHRAAELGDRATYVRSETYRGGLAEIDGPLDVVQPTTLAAARLVADLSAERSIERHPARGFATSRAEFVGWASRSGGRWLRMEDFYRETRRRLGVLMDGGSPVGGRWTFSADRCEPPSEHGQPRVVEPWCPTEDAIDAEVRDDLDALAAAGVQFSGEDAPRRLAATRAEALAVLDSFIEHRLPSFGQTWRSGDAVVREDRWIANSVLTAPLNLGLLDPLEVVRAAEQAYASGSAPLAAVESLIRQVIGWRDYDWHLYWFLGPYYCRPNAPRASQRAHHRQGLTLLGNHSVEDGWDPTQLTSWFERSAESHQGVVAPNAVGSSSNYLRLRSS